jgi:hypothetical protein
MFRMQNRMSIRDGQNVVTMVFGRFDYLAFGCPTLYNSGLGNSHSRMWGSKFSGWMPIVNEGNRWGNYIQSNIW